MTDLRSRLEITPDRIDALNNILLNPDMEIINEFLDVVQKYGTPEEINAKATEARKMDSLLAKVKETKPEYLEDLKWLEEQVNGNAFISVADYRRKILGDK